jgi:hypothetical protein
MVKARVAHTCTECHNTIDVGTLYEKVWGVWEGDMHTFSTCSQCFDIREFIRDNVPCVCYRYGDIWEDILENAREYSSEVPGMWVKVARVYVQLFPRTKNISHVAN